MMKKQGLVLLTLCLCAFGSLRADDGPGFRAAPFRGVPAPTDVVMYEVNERLYAPEQSLQAVTARLDEIQALGVNTLWLMPISEQGQVKAIHSPYCIKDYTAVEPEYGTLADLRELVAQAHSRGMAVIIDWVANHTSWDHPWLSTHKEWYTHDEAGNVVSPVATWRDVADLDFDNVEMRQAMIEAMRYWIREANIDGYRCDAADWVPFDFWKQAIDSLRVGGDRQILMLAEGERPDHFTAGFDLNYGWDFYAKLKKVYKGAADVALLDESHRKEYAEIPAGKHKLYFTTNHDESVSNDGPPPMLFGGVDGAMSAFVLASTFGGSPLMYSSQEIAYPDRLSFFAPVAVDWESQPKVTDDYKHLMQIYHASPALKNGTTQFFGNPDVACIYRQLGNDENLVLVNVRNESRRFELPARFADTAWSDRWNDQAYTLPATIDLAPFQFVILGK